MYHFSQDHFCFNGLFIYFCVMNDDKALKIELTEDGSSTIFVKSMNEHYHSVKGAISESNHIYRDCAFEYRCRQTKGKPLRLLEIGFGTGLNAVVTAMVAGENNPVHYITIEKYPLPEDIINKLDYHQTVDPVLFQAIHSCEWNKPVEITPFFTIEKLRGDYTVDVLPADIDVVYFDAFAPEKQPEMWTSKSFERLVDVMREGAVMTTYCAKGEIRRMLLSLGLSVERLEGPKGGKREILRATKL